jgi:hypothetical protein
MSDNNTELPPEAERILKDAERRARTKKKDEPPPDLTSEVVTNLAGLSPLQCAQQLPREARKYKVSIKALEKAVEAVKMEKEAETLLEPHWDVMPADEMTTSRPDSVALGGAFGGAFGSPVLAGAQGYLNAPRSR